MISFIIPFCSIDKKYNINIPDSWHNNNWYSMVTMTIKVIRNIEKYNGDYEIILVDNSNNWPQIGIPNLRVVKGYQHLTKMELLNEPHFTSHQDFDEDTTNSLKSDYFKQVIDLHIDEIATIVKKQF